MYHGPGPLKNAQRSQKEQYDQHSGSVYPVGCRVWLYCQKAGFSEPAKLHRQWRGPCGVIFVRSPTVYVTRDPQSASSDVLTAHYNQLNPAPSTSHCVTYDSGNPTGKGVSQCTHE
ncbi:hypothetical protein P879_01353 [Paragonimus westermani]|uniref:Uncharacterized protein n=1 Tax=Paragonimus westermani TaxID=34504 RepID=A0A8T0DXM0_9TREM|nr:hypothetical protein P879_01353 [Paragonimus westermani]